MSLLLLSARLHAFSVTSSSSGHTFLPSALPLAQRLHSVSVGFVTCGVFVFFRIYQLWKDLIVTLLDSFPPLCLPCAGLK